MTSVTPDSLLVQLADVNQRIARVNYNNQMAEKELFFGHVEGDKRNNLILSIALRDELKEELQSRKKLIETLLSNLEFTAP